MDALTREPVLAPSVRRTRRWRWLIGSLCVLVLAVVIWRWPVSPSPDKAALLREANQVIPVVQAVAIERDMPVWLDGLGTVQAFQTVTVKTMVDGPLVDVAFKEGQNVHAGDEWRRPRRRLVRAGPRLWRMSKGAMPAAASRSTRGR